MSFAICLKSVNKGNKNNTEDSERKSEWGFGEYVATTFQVKQVRPVCQSKVYRAEVTVEDNLTK